MNITYKQYMLHIKQWPRWCRESVLQTHPLSIQYGVEQVLIETDAVPPINDVCICCIDISDHINDEMKEHAKARLTWCLGKINANINGVYLTEGFDENGIIHTSERILLTRLSTSNIVAELAQNIINEECNIQLQTPKWLTDAERRLFADVSKELHNGEARQETVNEEASPRGSPREQVPTKEEVSIPEEVSTEEEKEVSTPKEVSPREEASTPKEVSPREKVSTPKEVSPREEVSTPKEVSPREEVSTPKEVSQREEVSTPKEVSQREKVSTPKEVPTQEEFSTREKVPVSESKTLDLDSVSIGNGLIQELHSPSQLSSIAMHQETIFVDSDGNVIERFHGVLSPNLLQHLAQQRASVITSNGQKVIVFRVAKQICVGNLVVQLRSYNDQSASYLCEHKTRTGIGPTRRAGDVSLMHALARLRFERR